MLIAEFLSFMEGCAGWCSGIQQAFITSAGGFALVGCSPVGSK